MKRIVLMEHIHTLTDDTGIFQHAKYSVPDRFHGYCTDDNSRALLAAVKHYRLAFDQKSWSLVNTYISFLNHAQLPDGRFHNFMDYDRKFTDEVGSADCFGRVIWALGGLLSTDIPDRVRLLGWHMFKAARPWIKGMISLRGTAYVLLGLCYIAESEWADEEIQNEISGCLSFLKGEYAKSRSDKWPWFEGIMTYSNALLPCAVIAGGCIAGDKEAVKTGVEALDFLSSVILSDGTLKLIGCNGWYPRGGKKAVFDEQPIDAMFSVLAYCEAYRRLGDIKYKELARSAFEWFLGRNNFGKAMYDPHTGACYDGLSQYGPNLNQGAESSLAYVIAQLSFIETFGTTAICNAGGA